MLKNVKFIWKIMEINCIMKQGLEMNRKKDNFIRLAKDVMGIKTNKNKGDPYSLYGLFDESVNSEEKANFHDFFKDSETATYKVATQEKGARRSLKNNRYKNKETAIERDSRIDGIVSVKDDSENNQTSLLHIPENTDEFFNLNINRENFFDGEDKAESLFATGASRLREKSEKGKSQSRFDLASKGIEEKICGTGKILHNEIHGNSIEVIAKCACMSKSNEVLIRGYLRGVRRWIEDNFDSVGVIQKNKEETILKAVYKGGQEVEKRKIIERCNTEISLLIRLITLLAFRGGIISRLNENFCLVIYVNIGGMNLIKILGDGMLLDRESGEILERREEESILEITPIDVYSRDNRTVVNKDGVINTFYLNSEDVDVVSVMAGARNLLNLKIKDNYEVKNGIES